MDDCSGPEPRKTSKNDVFLMFFGPGTGELMLGRWSPEPPKISKNDVFLMFFAVQALNGPTKTINHRSTNHQSLGGSGGIREALTISKDASRKHANSV